MDDAFASGTLDFQFSSGAATAADSIDETVPSLKAGDVGGLEEQLAMFSPEVQQQVYLQLMAQQSTSTESLQALSAEGTENGLTGRDPANEVNKINPILVHVAPLFLHFSYLTAFPAMRVKADASLCTLASTVISFRYPSD